MSSQSIRILIGRRQPLKILRNGAIVQPRVPLTPLQILIQDNLNDNLIVKLQNTLVVNLREVDLHEQQHVQEVHHLVETVQSTHVVLLSALVQLVLPGIPLPPRETVRTHLDHHVVVVLLEGRRLALQVGSSYRLLLPLLLMLPLLRAQRPILLIILLLILRINVPKTTAMRSNQRQFMQILMHIIEPQPMYQVEFIERSQPQHHPPQRVETTHRVPPDLAQSELPRHRQHGLHEQIDPPRRNRLQLLRRPLLERPQPETEHLHIEFDEEGVVHIEGNKRTDNLQDPETDRLPQLLPMVLHQVDQHVAGQNARAFHVLQTAPLGRLDEPHHHEQQLVHLVARQQVAADQREAAQLLTRVHELDVVAEEHEVTLVVVVVVDAARQVHPPQGGVGQGLQVALCGRRQYVHAHHAHHEHREVQVQFLRERSAQPVVVVQVAVERTQHVAHILEHLLLRLRQYMLQYQQQVLLDLHTDVLTRLVAPLRPRRDVVDEDPQHGERGVGEIQQGRTGQIDGRTVHLLLLPAHIGHKLIRHELYEEAGVFLEVVVVEIDDAADDPQQVLMLEHLDQLDQHPHDLLGLLPRQLPQLRREDVLLQRTHAPHGQHQPLALPALLAVAADGPRQHRVRQLAQQVALGRHPQLLAYVGPVVADDVQRPDLQDGRGGSQQPRHCQRGQTHQLRVERGETPHFGGQHVEEVAADLLQLLTLTANPLRNLLQREPNQLVGLADRPMQKRRVQEGHISPYPPSQLLIGLLPHHEHIPIAVHELGRTLPHLPCVLARPQQQRRQHLHQVVLQLLPVPHQVGLPAGTHHRREEVEQLPPHLARGGLREGRPHDLHEAVELSVEVAARGGGQLRVVALDDEHLLEEGLQVLGRPLPPVVVVELVVPLAPPLPHLPAVLLVARRQPVHRHPRKTDREIPELVLETHVQHLAHELDAEVDHLVEVGLLLPIAAQFKLVLPHGPPVLLALAASPVQHPGGLHNVVEHLAQPAAAVLDDLAERGQKASKQLYNPRYTSLKVCLLNLLKSCCIPAVIPSRKFNAACRCTRCSKHSTAGSQSRTASKATQPMMSLMILECWQLPHSERLVAKSDCRNYCRSDWLMPQVGSPLGWKELCQFERTQFLICARAAMAVLLAEECSTATRAGRQPSSCDSLPRIIVASLIASWVVALQERQRAACAVQNISCRDSSKRYSDAFCEKDISYILLPRSFGLKFQ